MAPITFADVSESIAAVLAKQWPDRIIYRDVCPAKFKRPSFFIQCVKTSLTPENRALSRYQADYLLTQFDEKDDYYEVSAERLLEEQVQVLALFSAPVLEVRGRFPSVTAVAGEGRDPDAAFVTIHAEWVGPSAAYLAEQATQAADAQMMEDFSVRKTDKKEC